MTAEMLPSAENQGAKELMNCHVSFSMCVVSFRPEARNARDVTEAPGFEQSSKIERVKMDVWAADPTRPQTRLNIHAFLLGCQLPVRDSYLTVL